MYRCTDVAGPDPAPALALELRAAVRDRDDEIDQGVMLLGAAGLALERREFLGRHRAQPA